MTDWKIHLDTFSSMKDPAVLHLESLPAEQVQAELFEAGVDPRPAIEAVKRLLREKLAPPLVRRADTPMRNAARCSRRR